MTSSTWYRKTFCQMKGNREYTRFGYEAAAARFDPTDLDVDCTGRHCMVTGGNRGIGYCTAQELARRGAVLHLVCRDMEAAKEARARIVTDTGNDKVHLYQLDLSQPRQVVQFCEEFVQSHDQLHVLINNAGVMLHEHTLDSDGIQGTFAVNTLALHLLTTAFAPLLQRSEDSRVITVSSGGMFSVRLDPTDLMFENMTPPFDGRLAYSQTKRQQVVLNLSYAQSFDKIHFSAMHPGWADTLAVKTALPEFYQTMKDKLRTPEQGADTIVWLAVSKAAKKYTSGLFFQDREAVATHLPLAWTRSTVADEKLLLEKLQEITNRVRQPPSELTIEPSEPGQIENGGATKAPGVDKLPGQVQEPAQSQLVENNEEPIISTQNKAPAEEILDENGQTSASVAVEATQELTVQHDGHTTVEIANNLSDDDKKESSSAQQLIDEVADVIEESSSAQQLIDEVADVIAIETADEKLETETNSQKLKLEMFSEETSSVTKTETVITKSSVETAVMTSTLESTHIEQSTKESTVS